MANLLKSIWGRLALKGFLEVISGWLPSNFVMSIRPCRLLCSQIGVRRVARTPSRSLSPHSTQPAPASPSHSFESH
jgi:hypothetical protein